MSVSPIIAVTVLAVLLTGCQTTTTSVTDGPARVTATVGAFQAKPSSAQQVGAAVGQGDDFAAAIAALASTPGTGVRSVSGSAAALAPAPKRSAPKKAVQAVVHPAPAMPTPVVTSVPVPTAPAASPAEPAVEAASAGPAVRRF